MQRGLGDEFDEALEVVVSRDEIGLGINLHEHALSALDDKADEAFGGDAARFLGGLGEPFLPQPVDGGFEIALGFRERRLAVHHADAGLLAQLLDEARTDLGHGLLRLGRKRLRFRDPGLDAAGQAHRLAEMMRVLGAEAATCE